MKTTRYLIAAKAALLLVNTLAATDNTQDDIFARQNIHTMMQKVNEYAKAHPMRKTDRDWVRATWYSGVMEAYFSTGDNRYLEQAQTWGEKHAWQVGTELSGMNRLFCAMTWTEMSLLKSDPKMIDPTLAWLATDAPNSPGRSNGDIWYGHAPAPYSKPVYADSLYGAPVFVQLYKATGDRKYIDMMNEVFWTVTDKTYDKDEDLYYRDPFYIGKKTAYGKKILWSRGNGWVFAAFPRILKHLPKDDPSYPRYIELFKKMAASLASRQQDDGFWRANLDDPFEYIMPESSGTAFFIAGFAWGVREGILDEATYLSVVIKGWRALVSSIHPDGKMGWVQPVDAQPRPASPETTQEYAVGLFLFAAGQVALLAKDGVVNEDKASAVLSGKDEFLPPAALKRNPLVEGDHPLGNQINTFLKAHRNFDFKPTGFTKNDYLELIAGQVRAISKYQNDEGRIIDPVEKGEKYYTTPCYAHSVAVLMKAGHPAGKELAESGMKALDIALKALADGKPAGGHGDFYTWPVVFACELFDDSASEDRKQEWDRLLKSINPAKSYSVLGYRRPVRPSDHRGFYDSFGPKFAHNWNLVNVAGEFARHQRVGSDLRYVDYCLTMQTANFTPFGMYNEHDNPLAYDAFARHYVCGMLERGYRSHVYTTYRDLMWRGAWTSLFMQSPFGEQPTGNRSSQHIWNEAEQAVIFESYASQYAKAGRAAEAGAFKRAAHLSLQSIQQWIRPDGSGHIVKNRFPIEAKHGYERYSVHTCYNMLACSMLAQAWQFADESVKEMPCPAELGGFAFEVPRFHKTFANAGGNYVEYDMTADHKYNPTGILRVHLKEGHPQLGPSDGCAPYFSGQGSFLAAGPAWRVDGKWTKLAECEGTTQKVSILEESATRVSFLVSYSDASQKITIDKYGVTVEDNVLLKGVDAIRVYYPMLVSDGTNETAIRLNGNSLHMNLDGRSVNFELLSPSGVKLIRSKEQLKHRNGMIEPVYCEINGTTAKYRISTGP